MALARKRSVKHDPGSVAALLAKKDIDAFAELADLYQTKLSANPDDYTKDEWKAKLADYEIVSQDGVKWLQLRIKHRMDIMLELAQYVAPKLRATEHHGTIDNRVLIEIVKFGVDDFNKAKAIDVEPPKQLPPSHD